MLHSHDFVPATHPERRDVDRLPIRFTAKLDDGSGRSVPVTVMNLSRCGFMAHCETPLPIGSDATFTAPNGETFLAQVRWALEGHIGCAFHEELGWEDVLGLGLEELSAGDIPGPQRAA